MNILMLNWRGPGHPHAGGAESVTLKHCQYWASLGHTVYWLTSRVSGLPHHETAAGIEIYRFGLDVFDVQFRAFLWYLFAKHPRFDVVIDQFHGIPFFTPLYVRQKIVAFIHEVAAPVWHLNPWPRPFNLLPAIFGRLFEPLVFKLYANTPFVTVSTSTANDLRKMGISNITIIPNGIELPPGIKSFPKEKKFTTIYLSALSKDKGIEDALTTFSILHKSYPGFQFWVVGKCDPKYQKQLIQIYPYVKFWGYVSESNKFHLLSRAHLLLFPSFHEGWGLVILEAAIVGTPAVAYKVSGVKDAILDKTTGLLVNPRHPQALVEAILNLHRSKPFLTQLSGNCLKYSKKFSWSIFQDQFANYLINFSSTRQT